MWIKQRLHPVYLLCFSFHKRINARLQIFSGIDFRWWLIIKYIKELFYIYMWLVISNNFFSVRLQVSKQENTFRSKPRVINLPFVCKCAAGKCCVLSCSPDEPLLQRPQPTIRRPFHELSLRPFPWQQFQKFQHARVRSLRAFCEPLLLINGYMEFFFH